MTSTVTTQPGSPPTPPAAGVHNRVAVFQGLMATTLKACTQQIDAERATLFFYSPKNDELYSFVMEETNLSEIRMPASTGIVGMVFQNRAPAIIHDAHADPMFFKEVDLRSGLLTRSMVCIPIITDDNRIRGVLQVSNKKGNDAQFDQSDIATLSTHAKEIIAWIQQAEKWQTILPGLAVVCPIAVLSRVIHGLLPVYAQSLVSEVLVAIAIGLIIANTINLSDRYRPGIQFSLQNLLRAAIVLLGARLALDQILSIGVHALGMIIALMIVAFVIAHGVGHLLKVPMRLLSLIAVGAAICGNTAIAALAPLIQAKEDEVSFAIAVNTLFGTLAVFAFPLIGIGFGLSDAVFGTWAGTAVNDTSQVIATGFSFSETAGEIATVVKLTRNALMAFVIVGVGMAYSQFDRGRIGGPTSFSSKLNKSFPRFLIGFMVLATINSLGWIDGLGKAIGLPVADGLIWFCKALILVALTGVALNTNFSKMARTGLRPVWVGLATVVSTATVSLLLIHWFGAAGM